MKLKNTEEKLTKVSGKQTDDSLLDQLRDKEETIVKLEMKIDELKSVANSNGDNGDKRLAMLERQFELLKVKYMLMVLWFLLQCTSTWLHFVFAGEVWRQN